MTIELVYYESVLRKLTQILAKNHCEKLTREPFFSTIVYSSHCKKFDRKSLDALIDHLLSFFFNSLALKVFFEISQFEAIKWRKKGYFDVVKFLGP